MKVKTGLVVADETNLNRNAHLLAWLFNIIITVIIAYDVVKSLPTTKLWTVY